MKLIISFRSHQLLRTRQVTKCAQCEHYVVFDAVKCSKCAIIFHKKCLGGVNISCGPSAITESSAQRRMSIFGVSLQGHLEAQDRKIPLILEKCVDELQKRGMTCKVSVLQQKKYPGLWHIEEIAREKYKNWKDLKINNNYFQKSFRYV